MGKEFYITFYMKSGQSYKVKTNTAEDVTVEDAWKGFCREIGNIESFRSGNQWISTKEVEYMEYFVPGSAV